MNLSFPVLRFEKSPQHTPRYGTLFFFFRITQNTTDTHNARMTLTPFECTYANTTLMSTSETTELAITKFTKSPQALFSMTKPVGCRMVTELTLTVI